MELGSLRDQELGSLRDQELGSLRDQELGSLRDQELCESQSRWPSWALMTLIVRTVSVDVKQH